MISEYCDDKPDSNRNAKVISPAPLQRNVNAKATLECITGYELTAANKYMKFDLICGDDKKWAGDTKCEGTTL